LHEAARALLSSDALSGQIIDEDWIHQTQGASILPHSVRVEVPLDGEQQLLNRSPNVLSWRESVRRGLMWALTAGYSVSAFAYDQEVGRGYYLLTKTPRVAANGRS
jgi:hypothetical protein